MMLTTLSSTALELNSSYYTTEFDSSSTLDGFSVSVIEPENTTSTPYMLPGYIRTTSMVVCITVMVLGIIGNLMVPLVVLRGKDMRNSTNIFLVNLSVADLCVLLICAPTVLVEVNSGPQVWPLGEHMCKAVPFVELTVAHASVLTILAISFERYYAICEPLKAGYICTKARATFLCFLAWVLAATCTSPMVWVSEYHEMAINTTMKMNGEIQVSKIAVCLMQANTTSTIAIFLLQNIIFFVVPLIILLILYSMIVRQLMNDSSSVTRSTSTSETYFSRARKQVIMMLLTVIFSFFICLAPFKILTFYIVIAPIEDIENINYDTFYNILYFSRIMFYLNSAINPILYNLMSSRFRIGFLKLCGMKKRTVHDRSTFRSTLTSIRASRRIINNSDQREHFFPILPMTKYILEKDEIGMEMPACQTSASTTLPMTFFLTTIIVFFVLPLVILVILYTVIAKNLMANPTISRGPANNLLKYRKQVVMMLGTVVISFFICLLPFRAFTLWILVASPASIIGLGVEGYFSLLYFCRVMFYLNSAVNPILYNLMSTKFRDGFLRLCGLSRKKRKATPNSDRTGMTNNNTTITHNSSSHRSSDFWRRSSSNKSCSVKVSSINAEKPFKLPIFSNVTGSINRKKDESYV